MTLILYRSIQCFVLMALALGCSESGKQKKAVPDQPPATGESRVSFSLSSPAFPDGEFIPGKYTCDSLNVSPPLQWADFPSGTVALALICDDPDAPVGTWVHWVAFNIPPQLTELPEGIQPDQTQFPGMRQGMNDFRNIGYGGPCPPSGKPHRYFFKLYALDTLLDLEPGATKGELIEAMKGHIIGEAQLVGKFQR